jgi:hypothetical protein
MRGGPKVQAGVRWAAAIGCAGVVLAGTTSAAVAGTAGTAVVGRAHTAGAARTAALTASANGTASAAVAGPLPRPPRTAAGAARRPAGHHRRGRNAYPRPRTVVRCQNDDSEQIDEIDNDGIAPSHVITPAGGAPAGSCAGAEDALGIARALAGDRPVRTVRPARR